jgi:hypothetical protein
VPREINKGGGGEREGAPPRAPGACPAEQPPAADCLPPPLVPRNVGVILLLEYTQIARLLALSHGLGMRNVTGSPDHLIRLEQDRRGNREPEGVGSLEVDDQLKLGGLLDR